MLFRPGNIGHLGRLGLFSGMQPSLIARVFEYVRLTNNGGGTSLNLLSVAGNTVTSTGAVTIAGSDFVEVFDNATWVIV